MRASLPATSFSSSSLSSSSSSSSSGDGGGAASPRAAAASASARRCCSRRSFQPGWCARLCAHSEDALPYDRAHPSMPHVNTFSSSLSHRRGLRFLGGGASAANSASAPTALASDARSTGPGDARGAPAAAGPTASTSSPPGAHPIISSAAAFSVSNWNCSTASESVRRFFPALGKTRVASAAFLSGGRSVARGAREGVPSRSPASPSVAAAANLEYSASEPSTPSSPAYPSAREESRAVAPTPASSSTAAAVAGDRSACFAAASDRARRGSRVWAPRRLPSRPRRPRRRPGARPAESRRPLRPTRGESRASRRANPTPRRRPPPPRRRARRRRARRGRFRRGELRGRRRYGPLAVHRVVRGGRTRREHVENMSRLLGGSRSLGLDDRPGRRHGCGAESGVFCRVSRSRRRAHRRLGLGRAARGGERGEVGQARGEEDLRVGKRVRGQRQRACSWTRAGGAPPSPIGGGAPRSWWVRG